MSEREAFGIRPLSDAMLRALPILLGVDAHMCERGANFHHPSGDYDLRIRSETIEGLTRRGLAQLSGEYPRRSVEITTRGRWIARSIDQEIAA